MLFLVTRVHLHTITCNFPFESYWFPLTDVFQVDSLCAISILHQWHNHSIFFIFQMQHFNAIPPSNDPHFQYLIHPLFCYFLYTSFILFFSLYILYSVFSLFPNPCWSGRSRKHFLPACVTKLYLLSKPQILIDNIITGEEKSTMHSTILYIS